MASSSPAADYTGFDQNGFANALLAADHIHANASLGHDPGWEPRGSSTNGKVVEYTYHDHADDEHLDYRSWYVETSLAPQNGGRAASLKIDYEVLGDNDHMTILCGFDHAGQLSSAHVAVQFDGDEDKNFALPPVKASEVGDVALAVFNNMTAQQKNVKYGNHNAGRHSLAYIAQVNIHALAAAMRH